MSDATFYKWKAKYGGLQVSDVRRLKDLEAENGKPFDVLDIVELAKPVTDQPWRIVSIGVRDWAYGF